MDNDGRSTSTLAIISVVSGALGWTLLPMVASIVAIITGHMARAEIRRSEGRIEGDGFAVAGLVLGWTSVVAGTLFVLAIILFFGGLAVLLGWLGLSGHLN